MTVWQLSASATPSKGACADNHLPTPLGALRGRHELWASTSRSKKIADGPTASTRSSCC